MEYHILVRSTKEKIASFENQQDRDLCLCALYDHHNDLPDDYFLIIDDDG